MRGRTGSVSHKRLDHDRVQFRWRNRVDPESGEALPASKRLKKKTLPGLPTEEDVLEVTAAIQRSLRRRGFWVPPDAEEGLFAEPDNNLEVAARAYLEWLGSRRQETTVSQARTNLRAVMAGIRRVHDVSDEDGIPVSMLDAETLPRVYALWRADPAIGESTVYDRGRYAVDLWRYLATFPHRWPDVVPFPAQHKTVMPAKPRRGVAPPAPTWAELDAVCRHAAHRRTSTGRLVRRKGRDIDRVFLVQRGTGVRVSSVLALRRRDVDLHRARLALDATFGETNKRHPRWTPVPRWLIEHMRPWGDGLAPDDLLFPGRRGQRREDLPSVTVRRILEAAIEAGELRPEVVQAPGRRNWRTTNLFRSGLQSELSDAGAPREGVDYLVGHLGKEVRERHYASAERRARKAAEMVVEAELGWEPTEG